MKKILLLSFLILTGCASKEVIQNDFSYACSDAQKLNNDDIPANVTDVCLPMDTYADKMHFHKTSPAEYRGMKPMDNAINDMGW